MEDNVKMSSADQQYIKGFEEKCAERGVDPEETLTAYAALTAEAPAQ